MSNGQVSNRVIADKIDNLTENIHQYRLAQEKRMVYLETCLEITKEDVDNLKKRDYIVGGATGILAVVAGYLGIQK